MNVVQFSSSGHHLLSGGADNSLFLWSMPPLIESENKAQTEEKEQKAKKQDIQHIATFKGHTDPILDACWGRDGE